MTSPTDNPYVTCPCCWAKFRLSEVMWIVARLPNQANLPELGDDYFRNSNSSRSQEFQLRRFLPKLFTPYDFRPIYDYPPIGSGEQASRPCERKFACPRCHMEIPERYFDCDPMYVSIVGPKTSGKTFFLTALHHRLIQNRIEKDYGISGISYDSAHYASKNKELDDKAKKLFEPSDESVKIAGTELSDHTITVTYPDKEEAHIAHPFTYMLTSSGKKHALCLYDCKGALFSEYKEGSEGGIEKADKIFMRNLLESDMLLFLYDPTFKDHNDAGIEHESKAIFEAMAEYLRNYSGRTDGIIQENGLIPGDRRYAKYICIIVTKFDAWQKRLPSDIQVLLRDYPKSKGVFNAGVVDAVSKGIESWIEQKDSGGVNDPGFVAAVRGFARDGSYYHYIPVSAVGRQADKDNAGDSVYNNTRSNPLISSWIDVPFIHTLLTQEAGR